MLFFRPFTALFEYNRLDDACYLEWAANAFGHFTKSCVSNSFPPGSAVAWFPAAFTSQMLSGFFSFNDLLPALAGGMTFAWWGLTLFLLKRMGISLWFLFATPVLYYAVHRTTMMQAPELFFAILTVHFVRKNKSWWALLSASVTFLIRIQSFPIFLLLLTCNRNLSLLSSAIAVVALAYVGAHGYNTDTTQSLIALWSPTHVYDIFMSGDFGLLWSAPWWVLMFVYGFTHKLSTLGRSGWAFMAISLAVASLMFGKYAHGCDFGQRYLISSYVGALLVSFELKGVWSKLAKPLLIVNAIWITWAEWVYKETPDLTPTFDKWFDWHNFDQMPNTFTSLFEIKKWVGPLIHSPLASLYYSYADPGSIHALFGVRIWIVLLLTAFSCYSLIVCMKNNRRNSLGGLL